MAGGRSLFMLHLICGLPKSTSTSFRSSRLVYCRLGTVIKQPRTHSEGRGSSQWSFGSCVIRCMSGETPVEGQRRMPARLVQKQHFLEEREADISEANVPTPRVTLDHVTLNYARSGGPGGQNVNKVNTKVDMRFKVMDAYWLPERIRLKLLQMEKNRVNNDGELVISSTKTRTQK
ncbi:hypothetical protein O6H91_12G096500 [Diphasiastrum complanatum]|nr:hypothetical protein O6H91_12G096500 [Diphasiastrum complanatum]